MTHLQTLILSGLALTVTAAKAWEGSKLQEIIDREHLILGTGSTTPLGISLMPKTI